jgi:hypothetical protein
MPSLSLSDHSIEVFAARQPRGLTRLVPDLGLFLLAFVLCLVYTSAILALKWVGRAQQDMVASQGSKA